ncbi:PepSY domain-containing protein [Glaciimonas soli]|uniref:PepSY domain-containing protein n=1 Tax=Glaciimonas soli TaxID=2590999 RepID=A0A843YRC9_9BURK|nr:PepSY domain-containing protein [Glaciimonas soli]MQR00547.1 PepSY domain-containing protein [Glaciimonas soli]
MKRWLFLAHRWLGIILCLFMAMWFFSGVVMMYVGYPKLTDSERLAKLPELACATSCISLENAVNVLPTMLQSSLTAITLTSVAGEPRYQFTGIGKRVFSVDARTGALVTAISEADALRAAHAFMPRAGMQYLDAVNEDTWTHSRGLDQHRPLHRVQMNDADSTLLYISSMTGDVVRKATHTERIWNYVGAWLHWLYAFRGGVLDAAWSNVVLYLSLAGVLLSFVGTVVGLMRWRFRGSYRSGAKTPYREFFMRWHHVIGLAFAGITITWIFSGLMSMNPWRIFDSHSSPLNKAVYVNGDESDGNLSPAKFQISASQAIDALQNILRPREISWHMLNGKPYLVGVNGAGRTRIVQVDGDTFSLREEFPTSQLVEAAKKLIPNAHAAIEVVNHYDAYYYARDAHTMMGNSEKRLPIVRVKFDDPQQTWLHLDPYTGTVEGTLTRTKRVYRWLFGLLHSWDLPIMLASRPLWDMALILLSAGGFLLSATGIVVAWRRLRKKLLE